MVIMELETTILELIYYLLSTVDNVGHKTKITNIKFSKINITLENDIEIIAQRSDSRKII